MTPPGPRDERERRARERRDDSSSYGRRSRSRERDLEHERRYAGRRARDDVAEYDREKDRFNFDARRVPSDTDRLRRPRTRSRSPRDRERERERARRSDADFGMAARLSGRPRDRDRPNNGGPFDATGRFRPDGADDRRDAAERKAPAAAAPPKPKFDSMPGVCRDNESAFTIHDAKQSLLHLHCTLLCDWFLVDNLLCEPGRKSRSERIAVIVRGPPGVGKTHVSKLIKVGCSSVPRACKL